MICYQCHDKIEDDQPFYNDYEKYVCKPCFGEAKRCFICRFPGNDLQEISGLGLECEFCRGNIVDESSDLDELTQPLKAFLLPFGVRPPEPLHWIFTDRLELRALQGDADLPPEEFIDDFLRYSYPVFHHEGRQYLLKRMTKPAFVVYTVIQLASGDLAGRFAQSNLVGHTPFHTFTRGWCHWLGYEAARLLGYDLEWRQLRKWPELGAQGEFERWERMSRVNHPAKMLTHLKATLPSLVKKHLAPPEKAP